MSVPLRTAIARLDLFAGASPEDIDAVANLAIEQRFRDGESIFSRGAPGEGMLIVLQGTIRLSIVSVEGRELILREAGPGDVIGEIAVLDSGRRTADATAVGPVVAGFIAQASFVRLLATRPALQMPILQVLCARLRDTTDQLESIALYPLEARLARFLLWHVKRYGRTRADGARSAPLTISQSAIASFVGASRPKVNRLLAAFEERGAIERRGAIVHCHVAALTQLAQAETVPGEAHAGAGQDAARG
ncbi:Crp/Fnr family transcriptional regulator [Labrys portucalensis]|uniref:Crp/Fnr family transcriptional regulator n=1 Tax=Labrys neptuniae TaxID=376174 RepID=A0ABV6ZFE6_9HYPH|nr:MULTISPECIES: Crp/Fnr family transcriptional regulator [Labrys]MDT3378660.1 Crp/Fnr family transcriptional regulator [Labrys neptuniae]